MYVTCNLGGFSSAGIVMGWLIDDDKVNIFNEWQTANGNPTLSTMGPVVLVEKWVLEELTPLELEALLLHEQGHIYHCHGLQETIEAVSTGMRCDTDNEIMADKYAVDHGANVDALINGCVKLLKKQKKHRGNGFYNEYKPNASHTMRARLEALKPLHMSW
jgi:Zn-dependent protease with chaperone function